MQPDDELCLCFHVSWRKAINFARIHEVRQASQMSECFGAGTGCGWCRKQLAKLAEAVQAQPPDTANLARWLEQRSPDREVYSAGREKYIEQGKGRPPT